MAVAHTNGCPHYIDVHVKQVKKHRASKEEMAESIMVATVLKAGFAMTQGVNALVAYDE